MVSVNGGITDVQEERLEVGTAPGHLLGLELDREKASAGAEAVTSSKSWHLATLPRCRVWWVVHQIQSMFIHFDLSSIAHTTLLLLTSLFLHCRTAYLLS